MGWPKPGNEKHSSVKYAAIAATAGDNTVVAAVTGKRIRVLAYVLVADAAGDARFESGAGGTALTGAMTFAGEGGGVSAPYNPAGWFETADEALLNLEATTAGFYGHLAYVEVEVT